ncbi:ChaN family lipoprotein [Ottowia sp.]|uniref:ChaN family lipoprotein n=1 Tax=Ottowia sp. TaxID=1898956 RepID=UPI002C9BBABA|nr:ChaN family lipoprotein [Ottowia sp.]HOB66302.1 ChaN family lipoprotein [Ottowia sp.]HPZ57315.1 ChaN family lipoprotein [Ottowia sp.]HQD47503.1 ChaN family lipoprotein [Ottowia sp.]
MTLRPCLPIAALCLAASALAGCAGVAPLAAAEQARVAALLPADALLIGEQHDADAHQRLQRRVVGWLAARGDLAALALEMAERGRGTAALPASASDAQVRAALDWHDDGWPWSRYGPVVMTAVRAGVPVLGANLPRAQMRAAMQDATLDARLPPQALAEQDARIQAAHCNALPTSQIRPMTRIQIARDRSMADTLVDARQPGRTVVLITGGGHTHRQLGVPWHLPAGLKSNVLLALAESAHAATNSEASWHTVPAGALREGDQVWRTAAPPPADHCAAFTRRAPAAPGQ